MSGVMDDSMAPFDLNLDLKVSGATIAEALIRFAASVNSASCSDDEVSELWC